MQRLVVARRSPAQNGEHRLVGTDHSRIRLMPHIANAMMASGFNPVAR